MVKINWTRQAIENIHEIREYFGHQSKRFAEELTDKFFEKAESLAKFPQIGRVVPEIGKPEIREVIFRNYRIIYHLVSTSQINIIAIHNSNRPLTEESLFE
ncbi:type II toxin-antitoxin system RelE/ParE family toxin [Adhaeribacter rhizoryzae]|uniref:Type II toxin-antitoxin system RelE/ParE family toxin n=1 Tax=Adhaeribacter rhizoryzae TaxID=2607907 RepID=A0A5M6DKE2_9BACT|nr:type II toxin-antitoxin system RelE/ParE family toxin [Adhaeribacter rhizoryzae]KAA5545795.1 type II toxin-antitoxin system RelE/ParE family toxin [Adhaeribacter rhizoryzae]